MKPKSLALLALLLVLLAVAACTSMHRGATDVNVSGEDIVYLKDERTNLCFAVLFVQNKVGTTVKMMAMTTVSCQELGPVPTK